MPFILVLILVSLITESFVTVWYSAAINARVKVNLTYLLPVIMTVTKSFAIALGIFIGIRISPFMPWIISSSLLMLIIGLKMVIETMHFSPEERIILIDNNRTVILLSLAGSFNTFFIGMAIGLISNNILEPVVFTALFTLLLASIAFFMGRKYGLQVFLRITGIVSGAIIAGVAIRSIILSLQPTVKSFFTAIVLLTALTMNGQPPAGYYSSATGLKGIQLQSALHLIIDNHSAQTYSSLHEHFESTDMKSDGTVWDMYSDNPDGNEPYTYHFTDSDQCGNYNSEGDCYNREHSWPKSWFDDNMPMYTDLFHLYPTDGYVNGRRGNYPYGEVGSASWTSLNGSKLGQCIYPGYTGTVFEPIDEYKGDLARTYFYMSVRYYGEDTGWPGSPQANGSQLTDWSLKMMLEWHEEDPVSDKETNRNNAVYEIQNNRNPFIDHPEYASLIWDPTTGLFDPVVTRNVSIYPVPANNYCFINHSGYYSSNGIQITVTDIAGRVFKVSYTNKGDQIEIDTKELEKGFYLITIEQQGKFPVSGKMIK